MSALLHRIAYYAAQRWRGEPVDRVLAELESSNAWAPERLRALQWERMVALVEHAHRTVPLYRDRLQAAGVATGALRGRDDWRRLPVLEKHDLQEHAGALR